MSLNYQLAYHAHSEIKLSTGRSVNVLSLNQCLTYSGLIEGVPDPALNNEILHRILRDAQSSALKNSKPYCVSLKRRDYLRTPGDMANKPRYSNSTIEWLPMVTCTALLDSTSPARDSRKDGSSLTVVWFQDDYAMPIAPEALQHIKELDWNKLATDYEC